VIESRHPSYHAGDRVWGTLSWQEYALSDGGGLFPLKKIAADVPLSYPLGVTGITGVTAYIGMLDFAKPQAGETVVVSAAAGATGSIAAQLAKLSGARVIGIAGGPEKCAWLLDGLKLDAAIDYKNEPLAERLEQLCPHGVNVYYDNVGGAMLDTAITRIGRYGRIILCGIISQGHGTDPMPPINNSIYLLMRSVSVMGFLIFNHMDRFELASAQLLDWVRAGKLKVREDIIDGLEHAPIALNRVFQGKNIGKQLVRIA
jgi:NADPH-dependent curcumin reductase CurA